MNSIDVLFLSQQDVRACAPSPREVLEVIEDVFRAHGKQQAVYGKMHLDLRDRHGGHFAAFPAYLDSQAGIVAGIKWLSNFAENPLTLGLPSVTALTILNDTTTGFPLVIMDGAYLTALRTAAASAVGAKYLARKDSSVVAIVGASNQGRAHLVALHDLFPLKAARVFDVADDVKQCFARELGQQLGLPVWAVESCEEAVRGADVVVLATSAKEPFFESGWCHPGMLLVTISGRQDLKPEVLHAVDTIVVDSIGGNDPPGALGFQSFFSQGLLSLEDIATTMADIASGRHKGRESKDEIVLFSPGGLGTEDIATARLVYERALEIGVGRRLSIL
jgi:ornithine cyclodeaminase/alanine dehydrogenase-like protein (mu-crystallin family)